MTDTTVDFNCDNSKEVVGTPTLALLPARNYKFKVLESKFEITIPREGVYSEIDPEHFVEEDGAFKILDEESKSLYLPSLTKILFATSKYPDLKSNQLFIPIALLFKSKEVSIIGQLIEMNS